MSLATDLRFELNEIRTNGLFDLLKTAAQNQDIPLEYILAIASRETNMVNETGDYVDGIPHGIGIMQIDIGSHPEAVQAARDGSWKTNPEVLINIGASILQDNIEWAKQAFPDYGGDNGRGWLKIAASAYNGGRGGATAGANEGDSDRFTTGHDYGIDVLHRMALLARML